MQLPLLFLANCRSQFNRRIYDFCASILLRASFRVLPHAREFHPPYIVYVTAYLIGRLSTVKYRPLSHFPHPHFLPCVSWPIARLSWLTRHSIYIRPPARVLSPLTWGKSHCCIHALPYIANWPVVYTRSHMLLFSASLAPSYRLIYRGMIHFSWYSWALDISPSVFDLLLIISGRNVLETLNRNY